MTATIQKDNSQRKMSKFFTQKLKPYESLSVGKLLAARVLRILCSPLSSHKDV